MARLGEAVPVRSGSEWRGRSLHVVTVMERQVAVRNGVAGRVSAVESRDGEVWYGLAVVKARLGVAVKVWSGLVSQVMKSLGLAVVMGSGVAR